MSLESRPAFLSVNITGLFFFLSDSRAEILDPLLNIIMLFEIASKTLKDAVCLHKCLFHLTATRNVVDVFGVIFVPNQNMNYLRIVCKVTPASTLKQN